MSKGRILDTNLIIRHLVQDHEQHAKVAGRLFEASDRGELRLIVLPFVLAECVFVLDSFYRQPRDRIAAALKVLLESPGIRIEDVRIHLDALERFRTTRLHFVDCLIASHAAASGTSVASFDRGLLKFSDVSIEVT